MTSKKDRIARNKEIQESAKRIIDSWPGWKQEYAENHTPATGAAWESRSAEGILSDVNTAYELIKKSSVKLPDTPYWRGMVESYEKVKSVKLFINWMEPLGGADTKYYVEPSHKMKLMPEIPMPVMRATECIPIDCDDKHAAPARAARKGE
ncbi:MAG: hypothetical protein GY849_17735 [Deltaproteobacteria bacterium]|nr:hypothetical protein [Deltaproteobacteria bacterium]